MKPLNLREWLDTQEQHRNGTVKEQPKRDSHPPAKVNETPKRKPKRKPEQFTERELKEMMGVNLATFQRRRGAVVRKR